MRCVAINQVCISLEPRESVGVRKPKKPAMSRPTLESLVQSSAHALAMDGKILRCSKCGICSPQSD
eukprot:465230-Alexandrium_andersonii.AAC.1